MNHVVEENDPHLSFVLESVSSQRKGRERKQLQGDKKNPYSAEFYSSSAKSNKRTNQVKAAENKAGEES